jgi:hypothetical protein
MQDTIVLRSPASCVASVPHLMGFTPEASIVIIWLDDNSIMLTQRVDYAHIKEAKKILEPGLNAKFGECIVLIYHDNLPSEDNDYDAFMDVAAGLLYVRDAIWVHGDRWQSLICQDASCCPPEGTQIDPSLAAEFIGTGSAPATHRSDLESQFESDYVFPNYTQVKGMVNDYLDAEVEEARDAYIERIRDIFYDYTDDEELVVAAVALYDVRVRDAILYEISNLPQDSLPEVLAIATRIIRLIPKADSAPICTVAALTSWMEGNGAVALILTKRALEADPGYTLADLVDLSLSTGMPPTAWRQSMQGITYQIARYGS